MHIPSIVRTSTRLIEDNAPTLLSGTAVVGTLATAYLAARGGMKAQSKFDHIDFVRGNSDAPKLPSTIKEKVQHSWVEFLPAAGAAGVTIASIVTAHKISAGRIAAMTAAYSLSEGKIKEYKRAVEEKLGIEKKEEIDKAAIQNKSDNAVAIEKQPQRPIIISGDHQLFYDVYSGRYFEASMEDVRSAENDMNYKVIQDNQCPLSHFYEVIGLPPIALGNDWGWDATCPPEFKYSPNIDDKSGKACIWLDFEVEPLRGWNHFE